MKSIAFAFVLPLLSVTPAFCQYYQPTPAIPSISVSGSAEVKVAPDEVVLNVGVETRDPKLPVAVQQNNAQVASALAFLHDAGVPDKDVQTDFISIAPEYRKETDTQVATYIVRKSIQIRLTKLDTMEAMLTGLLSNGINHVHDIDFRTTQLRKYRDEARLLATRAAREKATAIVTELGASLDKVSSVNILDYGGYYGPTSYWDRYGRRYGYAQSQNVIQNNSVQNEGGAAEAGGGTLAIGQISVSATVNVSFFIK